VSFLSALGQNGHGGLVVFPSPCYAPLHRDLPLEMLSHGILSTEVFQGVLVIPTCSKDRYLLSSCDIIYLISFFRVIFRSGLSENKEGIQFRSTIPP